jgi:GNAT superfamily N-acetyltransferase
VIRVGRADELERLQEIEIAAGRAFAGIGMDAIAGDEPFPVEELLAYQRDGRLWVWGDPAAAYLIAEWVDGCLHLEQVSVHPDQARQGIGRQLIEHVAAWAGTPVTLTTFADVPWNAPYYERLGFRRLADHELTDGLRRIRADEKARGLDRWPRLAMRRESAA